MKALLSRLKRPAGRDAALILLTALAILLLLLAGHGGPLDLADRAAYAVCHRIAERTYFFAGRPLPLCARCSGTYLAAVAGLLGLALGGRGRAIGFPAPRCLAVLAGFLLAWGIDGLNSYLTFFPSLPHLYEPANLLRLTTGALGGLVIAVFLLPVLNLTLWAPAAGRTARGAALRSWRDLAGLLAAAGLVTLLVGSEWAPLLYPLALLSGLAVVGLIGCVNLLLLLVVLRRDGRLRAWREALPFGAIAVALALAELAAIGLARTALTQRLGLPF
jgi:uncharacterized membrane protein